MKKPGELERKGEFAKQKCDWHKFECTTAAFISDTTLRRLYPAFDSLANAHQMSQYMNEDEEEQIQQEEEQQEQAEVADQEEELLVPGPTQTVAFVYGERAVPSDLPQHDLKALFAYEERLAAAADDEAAVELHAKLQAAYKLSSRVVREHAVDVGEDGVLVTTETGAMRWLAFEMPRAFVFDRPGFLVQGPPPQSKKHVPGQYTKPGPMTNFPREDVIIGSMSQLAQIDGRLVKSKTPWTTEQALQVQGATARINGRVLLGSGLLLSKRTVVAFPGVCQSEAKPISMSELDLSAAPFEEIKCAKNAAVLYTEPFEADYADLGLQNNVIDQYAVDGWKAEGDEQAEPLIPRFALVHRVVGTVGELIALLEAQLDDLRAKEASASPHAFAVAIEGALERIDHLKEEYEPEVEINCYAYQLLDEQQSVRAYSVKLATHNKVTTNAILRNNIKLLIERKNTITYTIDWCYKSSTEAEARTAFAQIALPIVPHAVYAQLHANADSIEPDEPQAPTTPVVAAAAAAPTTPKKGVKRTGAGVPIGAALTEDAVLKQETPARTVHFADQPALTVPPSRIGVSAANKLPAEAKAPAAAKPLAETKTPAAAKLPAEASLTKTPAAAKPPAEAGLTKTLTLNRLTAELAKTPAPVSTPPPAARTSAPSASDTFRKLKADGAPAKKVSSTPVKAEPSDEQPDAKKKRVHEPPAPARTPVQQAVFERLCEMLVNFKARPDVERFGAWNDLDTADAAQFADVVHPYPAENMNEALLDAATTLNFVGLADLLPRLLEQERAPAAVPPPAPVSRRPKIEV